MGTPLYDALTAFAASAPLRFDMPGHHGGPLPVKGLAGTALDFTEQGPTGNLFGEGGDAIEAAERLWAGSLGFDSCLFLTGGSTQGIHTGLALLAGMGGPVLMDRGSHRSAYNAMALLDLDPCYLPRPWLSGEGVAGPVDPAAVDRALEDRPDIKTVCIVSPTYYGVLSDIPAIAGVCRAHGAKLMVDGAHGAHLPFLGYEGYRAADAVVLSAHKTLPALGQSALLMANGCSMDELRRWGSVYGSSSPSYLLMASLDLARDHMEREGKTLYSRTAARCAALREHFSSLRPEKGLALDPTRLTVTCGDGFSLVGRLREQNIFPEMADKHHVVFILTGADGRSALDRLESALFPLLAEDPPPPDFFALCPPEPPERVLTPRQALFAPRRTVALDESAGEIASSQIAPYPPGVPVIAPGERICKKHLAYLKDIGYNNERIDIIDL